MRHCITGYDMTVQNIKDETQYELLLKAMFLRGIVDFEIVDYTLYLGESTSITAKIYENCPARWYFYEKNMKEISRMFPNMVFKIRGQGERYDDLWEKYFQNGDCEECCAEIRIPEPTRIRWE